MREGSLEAPTRHAIAWEDPDFTDRAKTEAEMHRIFDICHTCRRCFNLCDAFPRLFDLIDNSESGELDTVATADYQKVADACTLCDMCFMTKCPYVPPHEFNVDFPHVMLRYRAVERREGRIPLQQRELVKTDRNGRLASMVAPLANWVSDRKNTLTRPLLETAAGIDRNAALPKYHGPTFVMRSKRSVASVDRTAPAYGRKEGLAPGLSSLGGGVTVQLACHARAQNMGQKAAEMLRLLPQADVAVIERCSGHGGSWGVLKGNFETALKVGKPVARQALKNAKPFLASECPLAGMHIVQEMEMLADGQSVPPRSLHPIELVARAYGIPGAWAA